MEKKYPVKKNISFGVFLLSVGILILFFAYVFPLLTNDNFYLQDYLISSAFTIPVLLLFLWIWVDTSYEITGETLKIRSGPLRWKIDIKTIDKIRLNQDSWAGIWKPTLSWKCIQIRYKKYRAVYITPEQQDDFLKDLEAINPSIDIK